MSDESSDSADSAADQRRPDLPAAPAVFRDRIVGEGWEDPEQLLANPANFRIHPKAQEDALESVLTAVGWVQRVIVNQRTGFVVDGHLRVALAIKRSEPKVPCCYVDLSPEEEATILATFDPLSAMAGTDRDKLSELLNSIKTDDQQLVTFLADIRTRERIVDTPVAGRSDPDAAPEKRSATTIRRGDLFQLGAHRLLCGDCTVPADVSRVMSGEQAVLMNTDPPYGVKLDLSQNHAASNAAKGVTTQYREFEAIENDDLSGADLQAFLEAVIRVGVPHLSPNAAYYLWHPMLTQGTFFAAAAAADILIHRQIIWVKPHFVFGRGDYHWKHELCFYGWRTGNRPEFYGPRNQDTVWVLDEGGGSIRKDQGHPSQKPVELFRRPILNHTQTDDIVYEPFAGSGSQFIAAQELGRRCYGIEIDPGYCQVIIDRWEAFTGERAALIEAGADAPAQAASPDATEPPAEPPATASAAPRVSRARKSAAPVRQPGNKSGKKKPLLRTKKR